MFLDIAEISRCLFNSENTPGWKSLWRSSGQNHRGQIQNFHMLFYFLFLLSMLYLMWLSWKRVKWLLWLRIIRIHLYQLRLSKLDLSYVNWNLRGRQCAETGIRFRIWSWFHCKWIRNIKLREDHWLLTRRWLMGHCKTYAEDSDSWFWFLFQHVDYVTLTQALSFHLKQLWRWRLLGVSFSNYAWLRIHLT